MRRRLFVHKSIEVFEEITKSTDWVVPSGVYSVDVFVVAGGEKGENSDAYNAGSGGHGGECKTMKGISVQPFQVIPVVVGSMNGDSSFGSFVSCQGGGGTSGGRGVKGDGKSPSAGKRGNSGTAAFNNDFPDRFPSLYGAGGGAGAYVRGWDEGYFNGGKGGTTGGGDGAGSEDTQGVIINGKSGSPATFYGSGGGGASKAVNIGSSGGMGGKGYQGIVIIHYFKY